MIQKEGVRDERGKKNVKLERSGLSEGGKFAQESQTE